MIRIASILLLLVWTIQTLPELLHYWAHHGKEHTQHSDNPKEGTLLDAPHLHCKKTDPFTGLIHLHPATEKAKLIVFRLIPPSGWIDIHLDKLAYDRQGRAPPYHLI